MEDTIRIKSKEGDVVEFDSKLKDFCNGLTVYDFSEEVDLSDKASLVFLKTIKDFYEKNEFDKEKLKVVERISGNKLDENLPNAVNFELMKPFHDNALKEKHLNDLLDLQQGAELLRAQEFQQLVSVTIATVIYCGETEAEQKEYQKKWDIDDEDPSGILEKLYNEGETELLEAWEELNENLNKQFMKKLEELLADQ